MIPELRSAWLLHRRPYQESAVIAEFLLESQERLAMVVKGARAPRSAKMALLQPFAQVMVSWRGKGDLKTLHAIEPLQTFRLLGMHLYCGIYINELLLRAVMPGQLTEGLFELYSSAVSQLSRREPVQPVLRFFELQLLQLTGYLPCFNYDAYSGQAIKPDRWYRFKPTTGFIAIDEHQANNYDKHLVFHASVVKALAERDFSNKTYYYDFKRFSRLALAVLVGKKPLKSRELFLKGHNN
ncbi:MAG: DNA repair protein RecO [Endozoicomonas sp. (ex Botrylloides leachii)]|nr:DNA repair protein RecO [Endozoicomonas sp. (ex Botrylloides leachii)]